MAFKPGTPSFAMRIEPVFSAGLGDVGEISRPHRRQDMSGVSALGGPLTDQPGLLQPGQDQVH